MIHIKTLASSSKGNSYYITKNNDSLLLECGISLDKIQQGCNFKALSSDGLLVTHLHKDHSKYTQQFINKGVKTFCSKETIEDLKLFGAKTVEAGKSFNIKNWNIIPFETQHDCPGSLGYLIQHDKDYLVFATDTFYLKYIFPEATQFLIECNYISGILEMNLANGYIQKKQYERTLRSHMSLENLKSYFRLYENFNNVKEIKLIHLSDSNSDESRMINEVESITGCPTYIC